MRPKKFDKPLFSIVLALVIAGTIILASASIGLVGRTSLSPIDILLRQLAFGVGLGGIAFFIGLRLPYMLWYKISPFLFLGGLGLMILVFIPGIGAEFGGAKRWIHAGPLFFQPAEPLKLAFIAYLSSWIVSRKKEVESVRFGLIPFFCMVAVISALLLMQPDMGTLVVFVAIAIILFFIGGAKKIHLVGTMVVVGIIMSLFVYFEPYRKDRILVFFHPEQNVSDSGYQLHQALIAIGSGGIFGKGIGQSVQKFQYLPEATGDAIFAVAAEELGFIGSVGIILLFLFLLWRSVIILAKIPDLFARLLGSGIVIMIVLQSFINIGSFIGVIPMTGIPLVFISHGSSSFAAMLAGAGILINITKYAR